MSTQAATHDLRATHLDDAELHARLTHTWRTGPSLIARLSSVDHKIVGRRYILTAFFFLCLAGLSAVAMRLQLARPEAKLLGPDLYNQLFTMHGTTMMFLFAVPVMEAFAVYLVPLMLGTRNIAFPRLNAFSYWVYLSGGIFLWTSFMLKVGPDVGWFAYTPLSGPDFSPGKRVDVWAQMITFTEVSALAVAVEIIVTTFKQRAPGMTLDRIPLFVWSMLVTSFLIIFAMPAVMVASTMLILDRLVGTHFFNPAEGGDTLLWQHLFWFFGHPEVYIIFIPATGMVSSIIVTFSRRPGGSGPWRGVLLGSEDHRPHVERAHGPMEFLARLLRFQCRVLPNAHPRPARNAAARLHLPARDGVGLAEHARDRRRAHFVHQLPAAADQRHRQRIAWCSGRRQSLGCRHTRMGDHVTAAAV